MYTLRVPAQVRNAIYSGIDNDLIMCCIAVISAVLTNTCILMFDISEYHIEHTVHIRPRDEFTEYRFHTRYGGFV